MVKAKKLPPKPARYDLHLTALPGWVEKLLQPHINTSGRSQRTVGLLFLVAGLKQYDSLQCQTLDDFIRKNELQQLLMRPNHRKATQGELD